MLIMQVRGEDLVLAWSLPKDEGLATIEVILIYLVGDIQWVGMGGGNWREWVGMCGTGWWERVGILENTIAP